MPACLIDTSAWIHALRPDGDRVVAARVREALELGQAAGCSGVQLELWVGARGEREQAVLRDLHRSLPSLVVDEAVWLGAYELARRARARGVTAPATDVLIVACAQHHGASLLHADAHFDLLSGG